MDTLRPSPLRGRCLSFNIGVWVCVGEQMFSYCTFSNQTSETFLRHTKDDLKEKLNKRKRKAAIKNQKKKKRKGSDYEINKPQSNRMPGLSQHTVGNAQ